MSVVKKTVEDYMEKGKFYFLSGKYDSAIKEFREALKIEPRNTELLYSLGISYESSNRLDEAREAYLQTLDIDPNHKIAKQHLDNMLEK